VNGEQFTVTDDQIKAQLSMGCGYDGTNMHLLWSDLEVKIITEDGPRTARQAAWYLHTHHWIDDVFDICGNDQCVDIDHLTVSKTEADQHAAQRQADKEEELMQLVQRQSVTLASLYKKGKSRGLIGPSSQYGG
jgi:hypothetical protein